MSGQFEQEPKLQVLFGELKDGFQKLPSLPQARQAASLKTLTGKMQEAKTYVSPLNIVQCFTGGPQCCIIIH